MSPFAVASKSYAVNGAIAYEAQLIAAVVNTRSGIKGRLKYFFEGEGAALTCRVVGILDGEECEYRSPTIGSITTKNSPLWKSDPQQQLGYFSARSWARRHCPEVILGVYDREEMEHVVGSENARDITPSLQDRLAAAKALPHEPASAREGFDPAFVTRETQGLSAGSHDIEEQDPGSTPLEPEGVEVPQTDDSKQEAGAEGQEQSEPAPASEDFTADQNLLRYKMAECIDKFIKSATDPKLDARGRQDTVVYAKNHWKDELPTRPDFVKACTELANDIVLGRKTDAAARAEMERWLP
ncbi:MAG: recombinase RecT [bacterium]|nr:recombinase RecT [bacterium]